MSLWHHHSDLTVPTWLSDAIKGRSPGETQAPKTDLLDDNPLSVCCEWRLSYRGSPKLGVLESDAGERLILSGRIKWWVKVRVRVILGNEPFL